MGPVTFLLSRGISIAFMIFQYFFLLFFFQYLSSLNFSSKLLNFFYKFLNFLFMSWIDLFPSLICLFESSKRLLICFKTWLLDSLALHPFQYIGFLSLWSYELFKDSCCHNFSYILCFYVVICTSVGMHISSRTLVFLTLEILHCRIWGHSLQHDSLLLRLHVSLEFYNLKKWKC
jgi:hypothetical protein